MEYVYAATKQKPIIILMHESPETRAADLQEQQVEGKLKFSDFRKVLMREQPNNIFTGAIVSIWPMFYVTQFLH